MDGKYVISYAVFRRQYLSEVKRARRHGHNAAGRERETLGGKASVVQGSGVAQNGPPRALKTIVFNVIG